MTEEVKAPAIPSRFFGVAEYKRLAYRMDVPPGVPLDRILDADYYAHVADLLKPGYLIEALAVDGTYFAELLVRSVTKLDATVMLLRHVDLTGVKAPAPPTAEAFKVEFGGAHKWRVVRLSDNEVVHKGEPGEAEARQWLALYLAERVPA